MKRETKKVSVLGLAGLLAITTFLTGCLTGSEERTGTQSRPRSAVVHPSGQTPHPPRSADKPVVPPGPRSSIREDDRQASIERRSPAPDSKMRVQSDETVSGIRMTSERIPGYKTPAEYVRLSSKYVADAITAVALPLDYDTNTSKFYPLVIAFGGAGECAKPPRSGALAWLHYYKTDETVSALEANRLGKAAFRGLARNDEIATFNARLNKHPYRGIILACPYSPLLSAMHDLESQDYEHYIVRELIPALTARYRVEKGRVGVDGVSMGGARSLYFGLKYPNVFTTIGSIQGAFGPFLDLYERLIKSNSDILKKRSIQLVTSDGDYLHRSVEKMHGLLLKHGLPHLYYVLTGPHDYIFNQGPGSVALLVFHNEALNGPPAGPVK